VVALVRRLAWGSTQIKGTIGGNAEALGDAAAEKNDLPAGRGTALVNRKSLVG